jgi:hypothetical protein
MRTLTLRLPDELARKLTARARFEKTTQSAVLRGALADYLGDLSAPQEGSFVELAGDLAGCLEGPGDLSYSRKYFDGYGQ